MVSLLCLDMGRGAGAGDDATNKIPSRAHPHGRRQSALLDSPLGQLFRRALMHQIGPTTATGSPIVCPIFIHCAVQADMRLFRREWRDGASLLSVRGKARA